EHLRRGSERGAAGHDRHAGSRTPEGDQMSEDTSDTIVGLDAFIGAVLVDLPAGQDPVNVAMIRHWVEAMGLDPAIHLDEEAARSTGRPGLVAPAAMTQAWVMRGYAA